MNIPKIWKRAAGDVTGRLGPMRVVAWGWSQTDGAEAERAARAKLERISARIADGLDLPSGYDYGERPLREEILREIGSADDDGAMVVTRNAYGALILNTARVMFIDVDGATESVSSPSSWLGRWFSKSAPSGEDADPLARLRTRLERASDSSFRIYRTAAGFRLLATERLFVPGGDESEGIMKAVDADPAFVRLCRMQKSFRARLSPKPWRCDAPRPPAGFPREGDDDDRRHAAWLASYEARADEHATCRFVASTGRGRVHEAVQPILDLHDESTRASSTLPLA